MSDEWKRPVRGGKPGAQLHGRLAEQQKQINDLRGRAPLQNSTITEGGLTVVGENNEKIRLADGRVEILSSEPTDLPGYLFAGRDEVVYAPYMILVPPSRPGRAELEMSIVMTGRAQDGTPGVMTLNSPAEITAFAEGSMTLESVKDLYLNGRELRLAGTKLYLTANGTTTSPANTYISGSGSNVELRQVSSSIRYKVDVEDHHTDQEKLLAVEPRSWRDRAEADADPTTQARYVGFIAEELDELGLTEYVVYNPDGSPESVAYDRLSVGLLDVVKTQQKQLDWVLQKLEQVSGEPAPEFRPAPTPGVKATRPVPSEPVVSDPPADAPPESPAAPAVEPAEEPLESPTEEPAETPAEPNTEEPS